MYLFYIGCFVETPKRPIQSDKTVVLQYMYIYKYVGFYVLMATCLSVVTLHIFFKKSLEQCKLVVDGSGHEFIGRHVGLNLREILESLNKLGQVWVIV